MLYNIPGRTGINMSPETVAKLYNEFDSIIAIKEATGSLDQVSIFLLLLSGRVCVCFRMFSVLKFDLSDCF